MLKFGGVEQFLHRVAKYEKKVTTSKIQFLFLRMNLLRI